MAPKKKTKKKVAKRPAKRATQFTRSLRSTADQRGMGEGAVSREAGEATWALLQDPLTPVRNAAAFALASIRDPGIVQSFISALDGASSKEIARLAVLLGEAGFQNAAPYLKALFNKKDAKLSAALARGLGLLAERSAAPLLIEALDSDFVPVEAAEALGRLNAVEAFPALMRALSHKKDSVRAAAAYSLGSMGTVDEGQEHEAKALLRGLREDPSRRVRLCAAVALFERGDPDATDTIKAALS